MQAIHNINLLELLNTLISLSTAFLMGALIGFERQYRQRTAGLRTNVLVAVGAAIFVDMAFRIAGADGAARVASYVVSGVGFLGAGVIMREEGNVRGLNTAATLWGSAAIGACAGADMIAESFLGTVFVLAANTLLRPLVNTINRLPVDGATSELTYILRIIADDSQRQAAIQALDRLLQANHFPLSSLDVKAFGDDEVQIEATLMATSIEGRALDSLVTRLAAETSIRQVFWHPSTSE